jgi:hypothetical protein
MDIEKRNFDEFGGELSQTNKLAKQTRISFYFDDGDNWHFQLKNSASKAELREALLGVVELINKQK